MSPELNPQLMPASQETLRRLSPSEVVMLGNVAVAEEMPEGQITSESNLITREDAQQYVDEGIATLEKVANGQDIRLGEERYVHNIEAAYEAAVMENEIFDVYEEAHKENELHNAYEAAIKEDEAREAAKEEAAKSELKQTEDQKPNAQTNGITQEVTPSDPLLNNALSEREQANAALVRAGFSQEISPASQVTRDFQTGNVIVTDGDTVKIFDPRSNKPDITEYNFDSRSGTLSIDTSGVGRMTTHVGNYAPSQEFSSEQIILPPAVAKMVGSKTAVPIG